MYYVYVCGRGMCVEIKLQLGVKLRSVGLLAGTFAHWAILPAPKAVF